MFPQPCSPISLLAIPPPYFSLTGSHILMDYSEEKLQVCFILKREDIDKKYPTHWVSTTQSKHQPSCIIYVLGHVPPLSLGWRTNQNGGHYKSVPLLLWKLGGQHSEDKQWGTRYGWMSQGECYCYKCLSCSAVHRHGPTTSFSLEL